MVNNPGKSQGHDWEDPATYREGCKVLQPARLHKGLNYKPEGDTSVRCRLRVQSRGYLTKAAATASQQQLHSRNKMTVEFNILTPNAMLGYGYKAEHFWYGIEKFAPKAIIVDSGSTDGGPYKLGLNKMTCGRASYVRDLTPILQECFHRKIQVLISSAGGDGSDKHVQEMLEIIEEISKDEGFSFKVATVNAGFDRDLLNERISNGKVSPCGPVEELTIDSAGRAIDIVAQMGSEP